MDAFLNVLLVVCGVAAVSGPFLSSWIEKRLVGYLFVMGLASATLGRVWSEAVVIDALLRPMQVCMAVLFGALVFSFSHDKLRMGVRRAMDRVGTRAAVAGSVILVGFSAAFITLAIAVLLLVELLYALRLERESEINVCVLGCFAIGLGAGLTPIGGPVPAIAMSKLSGPPYMADHWFLFDMLGPWIFPAIVTLGVVAGVFHGKPAADREIPVKEDPYSLWTVLVLTGRMYVFIAGLVLLGAGLVPAIDRWLLDAPSGVLFWVNSVSAMVDGATLASVEITPRMRPEQLRYILMGVLIAGGALVPGNAPNLVASHKLDISYRTWAGVGLPIGGLLMVFYFISLGVISP